LIGCGSSRTQTEITEQKTPAVQTKSEATAGGASRPDSYKTPSPNKTTPIETAEQHTAVKNTKDYTTSDDIEKIMLFFTSDELKGREAGSPGIEKAADHIIAIFEKNNVLPYFSNYRDTLTNFDKTAYNVVGFVEGNDPDLKHEFILIGAHYDHIGILTAVEGDSIANGANDNASGTTTVLELATYFGTSKSNKRSILFALFSAEEKGLVGSWHLAKKLKEENLDLYTMLNFEMVGVPLVNKDYFMYVTGYELSNLAQVGNRIVNANLIGYLPQAEELNLFKRSDNYPFYEEFKIPSQTFCTFDFTNFAQYHQVGDEADIMNFDHMATLVNKTIPLIEGIANSPSKIISIK
jgi:aminopeptidase-like protein